jgi:outer membrane immunogenic protein
MRRALLVIAALVVADAAAAADLPSKRGYGPPPMPMRPGCAQFGGAYVGAHGGWNYYRSEWQDRDNYGFSFTGQDHVGDGALTANGYHAGAQAGMTWQSGCTIFGVQVDGSWTNVKGETTYQDFVPLTPSLPGTLSASSKVDWFGTARTRAGVVIDNLMIYATGGFAFAGFKRDFTYASAGVSPVSQQFTSTNWRVGYALGLGTEWQFAPNWSLGSEFMYMGFQKDEQTFACSAVASCLGRPVGTGYRFDFNDSMWVSRFALNYRFGSW